MHFTENSNGAMAAKASKDRALTIVPVAAMG